MKISITQKLLFLFLLAIFLTISASFSIHFMFFRPYFLSYTETRLLSVYEEVERNLGKENFQEMVSELDFRMQVGIIIADKNFNNLFFSHSLTEETKQMLKYELELFVETYQSDLTYSHICQELYETDLGGEEQLERMVFIKELPNGLYCILSHPLETLEGSMLAVNQFHVFAGLFACCFGICATVFFSKKFTKPILAINRATEKMTQLDFNQKIDYNSQDELGELSNNINILSTTIIDYKTTLEKEIQFQKILSQNMSHELKTPISVIQGYNQGISSGMAAKKGKVEKYHNVIFHECEQMTFLIDQMLGLSKLSSTLVESLEKSTFSSGEFADKIKLQHRNLMEQNNITFTQDIDDFLLWGNLDLLLQGFGNFVTNAVKYGDGKEIIIKIKKIDNFQVYSLFNTGSPIPESELKHIFSVFYMVDKARSREKNSHGLGLSVCHSIAELHKGSVYCENAENGVIFHLKIPNK